MKVYVVVDLTYDGGLLGVYENRNDAVAIAKEKDWDNPVVLAKYEYDVYEMDLIVSTKSREGVEG